MACSTKSFPFAAFSSLQPELFNGITRAAVPLLREEGIKMTAANKHPFLSSRLIRLIVQTERLGG